MTDTAPSQEETPTCRVRHFSPDPNDDSKTVGADRVQVIARHKLGEYQAKGFVEVDENGEPSAAKPAAASKPAGKNTSPSGSTGGND